MPSTDLVHVHVGRVYDSRTRTVRAIAALKRLAEKLDSKLPTRLRAYLARYWYDGKHLDKPGEEIEQAIRERNAAGQIISETRIIIPAQPTMRDRIRQVRQQRRNSVPPVRHHTGTFPLVIKEEEDTWSWNTADDWSREHQRKINNAQLMMSGAEGPLAP